jgi:hypothetical protein
MRILVSISAALLQNAYKAKEYTMQFYFQSATFFYWIVIVEMDFIIKNENITLILCKTG